MKSILLLTSCLAASYAAPSLIWTPGLGAFYAAVDKEVVDARKDGKVTAPTCDLSKASMPVAPTPLPTPDPSWTLSEVVVGRGVQNYTCALATTDTKPVSIGALANLYNVSCVASNYGNILAMLPGLALEYPLPSDPNGVLEPSNLVLAGYHYFVNTTPTFDLTVNKVRDLGMGRFKKTANSTAPTTAPKGQNGAGDGAVPWLMLTATNATVGNLAAVYRINTAGGQPPDNCQSSPAAFSVQYSAEYWFYTHS